MDWTGIVEKGKQGLLCASMGKLSEWLDEYKKAITVMETFGFTMGKLEVETSLPPKVHTSILGSINNIQTEKLNKLIEEHRGETLLVTILKSLVLVRQIWECLELKLTGVVLKVTLGVPPKIDAEIC
jgi:hypothetical protein